MRAIAIIPARGGSKRIPKKNIIDFNGKPMIAWTIEAALRSTLFEKVIVSTDDEEIASIARAHGAEAPFLRTKAGDDFSPVSSATLAALQQAEQYWQQTYETVVQLMPNCPLRCEKEIISALDEFQVNDSDFLISAFEFGWMNPWWASTLDESNRPTPIFPGALKKRSQDLENLYCPSGAIWIAKAAKLKRSQTFYGDGHVFFPIPWTAAVDIDDYNDLSMAQAIFKMVNNT